VRLVVVDGGEVGLDRSLVNAEVGVHELGLMVAPALDPVVRQPQRVDLLQPRHHLRPRPRHRDEVLRVAGRAATARRATRPVLLPLGRSSRGALDRAAGHPLHPAALAASLAVGGRIRVRGKQRRSAALPLTQLHITRLVLPVIDTQRGERLERAKQQLVQRVHTL